MANTIQGVSVNSTKFIGVTDLKTLASAGISRPSSKASELGGSDKAYSNCHELRQDIQRAFNKARKDNAQSYARYIRGLETKGAAGGCPPINLFTPSVCRIENGMLEIPFRASLVAIDGETQLEARFILLDEDVKNAADWKIPVVIWHGCGDDMARQYLVDTNLYANPINSVTAMSMDRTGRLTAAVKMAIKNAGYTDKQINQASDLPGKRKAITLRQVTAATVGYILGDFIAEKSYLNVVDELNSSVPVSNRFEFDAVQVADAVTSILRAAAHQETLHVTKPTVFQAAGIKVKRGAVADQLKFLNGSIKTPTKGGQGKKMSAALASL